MGQGFFRFQKTWIVQTVRREGYLPNRTRLPWATACRHLPPRLHQSGHEILYPPWCLRHPRKLFSSPSAKKRLLRKRDKISLCSWKLLVPRCKPRLAWRDNRFTTCTTRLPISSRWITPLSMDCILRRIIRVHPLHFRHGLLATVATCFVKKLLLSYHFVFCANTLCNFKKLDRVVCSFTPVKGDWDWLSLYQAYFPYRNGMTYSTKLLYEVKRHELFPP